MRKSFKYLIFTIHGNVWYKRVQGRQLCPRMENICCETLMCTDVRTATVLNKV